MKIFLRDRFTCAYCFIQYNTNYLEVDHIFPQSKGGKHEPKNLVTACKKCNRKKSAKIIPDPPHPRGFELTAGDLEEDSEFHYPTYTFRLDEKAIKKLNKLKIKTGLSWNRLFQALLTDYENLRGRVHNREKPVENRRGVRSNGREPQITGDAGSTEKLVFKQ